ncbi:hypothetical protein [Metamycoplasma hyosynoviae]|uniref:hypothetical protein n=1 Tax=Metamycoplasma hyosynoviae TaxID=29559 RepID=UPI00235954E6|nr:hypothetical protein [Metamycoplasma hyosynoviae]MDC8911954.1 hypothetical protein [Metamycoplasma hyosynoviae]
MAEKKFLLRETIHPQTKQNVYLISEVGVQEKPVVLPNLLESLSLYTIFRCRIYTFFWYCVWQLH